MAALHLFVRTHIYYVYLRSNKLFMQATKDLKKYILRHNVCLANLNGWAENVRWAEEHVQHLGKRVGWSEWTCLARNALRL